VQLRVNDWGSGPRTAVLIHGFSDDAETWWRVGPALADLGFTVLAPELRGHGRSERAASYALHEFADDLVESLPTGADVVIGHSLGALVLGLAAPRLAPLRAVFIDPPWLRPFSAVELDRALPSTPDHLPPHWSPEEVAVDLASNERTDPAVARGLLSGARVGAFFPVPPAPHPGALVLVPERDPLLPESAHEAVHAAGYEIRTQPGVGHVMHRDDLEGFMTLLRPHLSEGVAA